MSDPNLREQIATELRERSVSVVAKELGLAREPLLAFALGVARNGTDLLVADRVAQRAAAQRVAAVRK